MSSDIGSTMIAHKDLSVASHNLSTLGDQPVNASRLDNIKRNDPEKTTVRKPRYFVHIHKSGGTTICDLARKQPSVRVPFFDPPYANCNYRPAQSLLTSIPPQLLNTTNETHLDGISPYCMVLSRKAKLDNVNFFMFEPPLMQSFSPTTMLCPELFSYGIMIRNSISRLQSWINYEPLELPPNLGNCTRQARMKTCQLSQVENCGVLKPSDLLNLDNALTRSLIGASASPREDFSRYCTQSSCVPFGMISSSHVDLARGVLSQFDVVLILEDLGTSHAWQDELKTKWGWSNFTVKKMNPNRRKFRVLSNETLHLLAGLNQYDDELYRWAQLRARSAPNQLHEREPSLNSSIFP